MNVPSVTVLNYYCTITPFSAPLNCMLNKSFIKHALCVKMHSLSMTAAQQGNNQTQTLLMRSQEAFFKATYFGREPRRNLLQQASQHRHLHLLSHSGVAAADNIKLSPFLETGEFLCAFILRQL